MADLVNKDELIEMAARERMREAHRLLELRRQRGYTYYLLNKSSLSFPEGYTDYHLRPIDRVEDRFNQAIGRASKPYPLTVIDWGGHLRFISMGGQPEPDWNEVFKWVAPEVVRLQIEPMKKWIKEDVYNRFIEAYNSDYPMEWKAGIPQARCREMAGHECEMCDAQFKQGTNFCINYKNKNGRPRIGTVHHINGMKHDLRPENLAYLCQSCHMRVQYTWTPPDPIPADWVRRGFKIEWAKKYKPVV